MDKNFLLAFLLSTVAIFLYYTLFPPAKPVVEQPDTKTVEIVESLANQETPNVQTVNQVSKEESEESKEITAARKTVTVESSLYYAEIDSQDGTLKKFLLKNYKYSSKPHFNIVNWFLAIFTGDRKEPPVYDPDRLVNMAGDLSPENRIWKVYTDQSNTSVNFQTSADRIKVVDRPKILTLQAFLPSGLKLSKTLTFIPDSYLIDMEIRITNQTDKPHQLSLRFNLGAGNESIDGELFPKPKIGVSFIDDDFEKYDDDDFENPLKISQSVWAGVMDNYFLTAIGVGEIDNVFNAEISSLPSILNNEKISIPKLEYVDKPLMLGSNQEYRRIFRLYIGPKQQSELEKFDFHLPQTMDLGWFDFLAHPMLSVLRWLQKYVVNWGVAIILLTIIVRLAMFPLAYKGMSSMRKMSHLNPKIKTIREKYKGNKERMNKEIMKFYGQHKVNPMGGCLPMGLQIPIFISLYQALLPAIELRHAPFIFWLDDLSAADFTLILPVLMGVSMFFQQTLAPTPAMDPTQAKIMKWMPAMMVLFFLNMPSGLVLYWVISNMLSIGQQLIFNKVKPYPTEKVETKATKKKKRKH